MTVRTLLKFGENGKNSFFDLRQSHVAGGGLMPFRANQRANTPVKRTLEAVERTLPIPPRHSQNMDLQKFIRIFADRKVLKLHVY